MLFARNGRLWLVLAAMLLCVAAIAQPISSPQTDSSPITIVEVSCPTPEAAHRLAQDGYVVDALHGKTAVIYASEVELKRLYATGYPVTIVGVNPVPTAEKTPSGYHNYAELTTALETFAADYPDLCRLFTLGQSVQGRELWAMQISDNPDTEEDEPEFKYVSTMHGDEPVGVEMCLRFIEYLLQNYAGNSRVSALVNNTELWIVPLMNPDGRELKTRFNASRVDLNRSFPVYPEDYAGTFFDGVDPDISGRPVEVQHVMNWTLANRFVLSANFHGGAMVVNYPYDEDNLPSGQDAPSPDDLLFEYMSRGYTVHNTPMYNSTEFEDGITNGTAWYILVGGMQDWNYRYTGCMEVTIELNNTKWPAGTLIPSLWDNNRESMLTYAEFTQIGVRGMVTDRFDGAPLLAKITVAGNTQPVFTDPDVGDYHRLLLPGSCDLLLEAPGFIPYHVDDVAVTDGPATRVDISLSDGDLNKDSVVDGQDVQNAVQVVMANAVDADADVDGRGLSATDIQAVINQAAYSVQDK